MELKKLDNSEAVTFAFGAGVALALIVDMILGNSSQGSASALSYEENSSHIKNVTVERNNTVETIHHFWKPLIWGTVAGGLAGISVGISIMGGLVAWGL